MLFLYDILNFRRILYVSYLKIHNHKFLATSPERLGAEIDDPSKKKCVSRCRCSYSGHDSPETACEVSHFASTNLSEIMKHLQRALDMQVWIFIVPRAFLTVSIQTCAFIFQGKRAHILQIYKDAIIKMTRTSLINMGCKRAGLGALGYLESTAVLNCRGLTVGW